ncbi:hypothetical protein EYF80_022229 [Liparis tanakae]|uniref:Uncharacterized protein n=1 Tax=Liparis tanakae TaxID=230148 RepID=A0A4Z2HNX3_9TELE|nr:hypothetical protein EYF80_022229 [Liparis tanakae]
MYSGQAVDTSFPGGPSGQHTMPSHSGEQKPSADTKATSNFLKIEPAERRAPRAAGRSQGRPCCVCSRLRLSSKKNEARLNMTESNTAARCFLAGMIGDLLGFSKTHSVTALVLQPCKVPSRHLNSYR